MHPFSKLRCNECDVAFRFYQCEYADQQCEPCMSSHTCPTCHTSAYYSSLNLFEQEELLDIVQHIASFHFIDHLDIMKEVSSCLSYTTWFETTHPLIEACLNALPENEQVVRAYLEHIYEQVFEKVL
jgi:hypothetical protein